MSCRVEGIEGQCSVTASLWASRVSSATDSAPWAANSAAGTFGSLARTRQPNPRRRSATERPIRPNPTTPTVMSRRVFIRSRGPASPHPPSRTSRPLAEIRRVASSRRAERVVGDLVDAVGRDVADGDAAIPGGVEVHVVHADPVADDQLGPAHRGDHPGGDRGELREDVIGRRGPRRGGRPRSGTGGRRSPRRGGGGSPPRCRGGRTCNRSRGPSASIAGSLAKARRLRRDGQYTRPRRRSKGRRWPRADRTQAVRGRRPGLPVAGSRRAATKTPPAA